jgi:hypothetical protein
MGVGGGRDAHRDGRPLDQVVAEFLRIIDQSPR